MDQRVVGVHSTSNLQKFAMGFLDLFKGSSPSAQKRKDYDMEKVSAAMARFWRLPGDNGAIPVVTYGTFDWQL